jgi:iron complex transport system substrate-binding protein
LHRVQPNPFAEVTERQAEQARINGLLRGLLAAFVVAMFGLAAVAAKRLPEPMATVVEDGQPTPPGAGARPVEIVAENSEYRIVRHAAGETRVPANPQRICALACADELLSIGVKPTAHSINDGWFPDYLAGQLDGVPWIPNVYGNTMPNMEAIIAVRPDLIITRATSRQTYLQLSQIAPVVVLLDHLENYRQRVRDVGAIVGRPEAAAARVAWYDAKVQAARRVLKERMGDQTLAFLRVRPRTYRLHGADHHVWPVLYGDLQVKPPRIVAEKLWESTMSPEGLLQLDADYLIVAADSTQGSGRTLAELLGHPVWDRLPAVRAGKVHMISKYRHWADAGILGRARAIDDVLHAVAPEAVDAVNAEADAEWRRNGA